MRDGDMYAKASNLDLLEEVEQLRADLAAQEVITQVGAQALSDAKAECARLRAENALLAQSNDVLRSDKESFREAAWVLNEDLTKVKALLREARDFLAAREAVFSKLEEYRELINKFDEALCK